MATKNEQDGDAHRDKRTRRLGIEVAEEPENNFDGTAESGLDHLQLILINLDDGAREAFFSTGFKMMADRLRHTWFKNPGSLQFRSAKERAACSVLSILGAGPETDSDEFGWEDDDDDDDDDDTLGGAALRSCIQGEGEPPHELLLAAVACAASGTVRGVPVQRLREDDVTIISLDLDEPSSGVISAGLLGLMLPAATSVRSLRCPSDNALRQRSRPAFPLPHRSARFPCQPPPVQVFAQVYAAAFLVSTHCLLSHSVPSCPSLAVSEATRSESRAPLHSLPSSTRRRSPASSAPLLPKCLLSCQRPLTRLLVQSLTISHLAPRSQSRSQRHRRQGRHCARCHPQRDEDHQPQVRAPPAKRCFCVSAR